MIGSIRLQWKNTVYLIDDEVFVESIDLLGSGESQDEVLEEIYDMYTDTIIALPPNSDSSDDLLFVYLEAHDSLAERVGVTYICGDAYANEGDEGDPRGHKAFTRANL
jgi:hypothetical protein